MSPLNKYAAKKKITKELLAKMLYGKKPVVGKKFRRLGAMYGAGTGGELGATAGMLAHPHGRKMVRLQREVAKAMKTEKRGVGESKELFEARVMKRVFNRKTGPVKGLSDNSDFGSTYKSLEDQAKMRGAGGIGFVGGAAVGGKAGHMAGKALDKRLARKVLSKYHKRQLATNVGLGAGGAGGLAALLSQKEKRASKYPPPIAKKEFVQGSKPTPPKSKKPFLNKLTSGKFSILPGLSNTTQKWGGSKPALGARLQWRF